MGHGRFRPDVFTLTNQSDGELVLLVEAPRGYDEPQTLSLRDQLNLSGRS